MATWGILFAVVLMVPGLMILFGWLIYKNPPEQINSVYGYRTALSMKNNDTWRFANMYFGRISIKLNATVMVIAALIMLVLLPCDKDTIATWGTVLTISETAVIIITIPFTESALKRKFDRDGNPK